MNYIYIYNSYIYIYIYIYTIHTYQVLDLDGLSLLSPPRGILAGGVALTRAWLSRLRDAQARLHTFCSVNWCYFTPTPRHACTRFTV